MRWMMIFGMLFLAVSLTMGCKKPNPDTDPPVQELDVPTVEG